MSIHEHAPVRFGETPTWLNDRGLFANKYQGASLLTKADMLDRLSHNILGADPQVSMLDYYRKVVRFLPGRTPQVDVEVAIKALDDTDLKTKEAAGMVLGFWATKTILTVVEGESRLNDEEKGDLFEDVVSSLAIGQLRLFSGAKPYATYLNNKVNAALEKYLENKECRGSWELPEGIVREDDSAYDTVVEETAERERRYNLIKGANMALKPPEKTVIYKRFAEEKTLREIAKDMGVTPERPRQREARALRTLRHPKLTRPLLDFYPPYSEPTTPRNWRVEELDPTEEQLQVVLECLPDRATAGRLPLPRQAVNKISALGYYFRLKELLGMSSADLERTFGWEYGQVESALKYHAKELFSEVLAGGAFWVGDRAEEARNMLIILEGQKRARGLERKQVREREPQRYSAVGQEVVEPRTDVFEKPGEQGRWGR